MKIWLNNVFPSGGIQSIMYPLFQQLQRHYFEPVGTFVDHHQAGRDNHQASTVVVWEWNIPSYDDIIHNDTAIRVGLIPLSLKFWIQSFIFLCLQSLFNILVAVVVYHWFVVQSTTAKTSSTTTDKTATTKKERPSPKLNHLFFGYGILCPFLIVFPLYLVGRIIQLDNIALLLCLAGAIPNLLILRVMEAIHGLLPDFCYDNDVAGDHTKLASKNSSNNNTTTEGRTLIHTTTSLSSSSSSSSSSCTDPYHHQIETNPSKLITCNQTTTEPSPESDSSDYWNGPLYMLVLYFSAPLQFRFDPKTNQPVPFTRTLLLQKVTKFVSVFVQTSLLYSILLPVHYQLFYQPSMKWNDTTTNSTTTTDMMSDGWGWMTTSSIVISTMASVLWKFYHPTKLLNSFLMASLLSLVLDGGASGLGLLFSIITGLTMEDFCDNPLTQSTSPSDFWGRRWDRPVASALKRGAYLPLRIRAGMSRNVASLVTFALSGFIHEYVLFFLSLRKDTDYVYWRSPTWGRQCLFFVINGIVLVTERLLVSSRTTNMVIHKYMTTLERLPHPLRTILVLLIVLPIGHWFTDEYVASSFFADASNGFPRLTMEILHANEKLWLTERMRG